MTAHRFDLSIRCGLTVLQKEASGLLIRYVVANVVLIYRGLLPRRKPYSGTSKVPRVAYCAFLLYVPITLSDHGRGICSKRKHI